MAKVAGRVKQMRNQIDHKGQELNEMQLGNVHTTELTIFRSSAALRQSWRRNGARFVNCVLQVSCMF
jgi:hypothetical protein